MTLEVKNRVNTKLPPCCMVVVGSFLVVGTYKLEQGSDRWGTIDVYDFELNLVSSCRVDSAILDIYLHQNLIYTAHSTGKVCVWQLEDTEVAKVREYCVGETTDLVLQFDFRDSLMAYTLTNGTVNLFDIERQETLWSTHSHDYDPWCVRFVDETVISGGDDMALCCHDLASGSLLWRMTHHDAGITSILPREDGLLWTGGYDDKLRLVDTNTRRSTESIDLGGGVWRLIEGVETKRILACCMYGGLRVLEPRDPAHLPTVVGSLTNHESMVYGGAWVGTTGYTCSFYDCLIQSWHDV